MDEAIHAPALEFVERYPFELELVVSEHARNARPHVLRLLLDNRIGIAIELEVDAPDVVGLPVQQRRTSRMEGRIKPEPALGRKFRRHLDVGDQELILEHLAAEFRADHLPQRGARTIAGDDVLRVHAIGAFGRVDRQRDGIVALLQRRYLVAPAKVDLGQVRDAIDEIGFRVILLEVDEGRPLVAVFRQQIELVELGLAMKDPADAPHHALCDHTVADAEPVPVFQRALREADRARALADAVGIIQQHDALAALREIDRQRQSNRPGAHHHDRVLGGILAGAILIGVTAVAELGFYLRHALTSALVRRGLIC
jgi:hypothetical protein